jgi:Spy/CpxP family protein refolding chaperone
MRPRLPWILLAVSVALNVLLIGFGVGFLWHRPPEGGPLAMDRQQRVEAVTRELGLQPQQREAFRQFVQHTQQAQRALREKNQPILEATRRELIKPTPDEAALDRLFGEVTANRRAFQDETSHAMRQFLTTLTPEQRDGFLRLWRDRVERGGGPGGPRRPAPPG